VIYRPLYFSFFGVFMNERAIVDVLRNAGVQASSVRRLIKSKSRFGKSCYIARAKVKELMEYSPKRLNLKVIRALRDLGLELDPMQKVILMQNKELSTRKFW
jgi:hypothetical protein